MKLGIFVRHLITNTLLRKDVLSCIVLNHLYSNYNRDMVIYRVVRTVSPSSF